VPSPQAKLNSKNNHQSLKMELCFITSNLYNSTRAYQNPICDLLTCCWNISAARTASWQGEGEVVDAIGDKIVVKLDDGRTQNFPSDDLQDNNSAG
jgi:hypothetical protein